MKTSLLAAVCATLAVVAAAGPAAARPMRTAALVAPAPSAPAVDPKTDSRRVCVVDDVTGTRLAKKVCRTRADWIAQTGVDPLTEN